MPSPAEVLGTPVRKVERRLIGAKDLAGERELQKKRMNKMLNIFPDQREVTIMKEKEAEAASNKEESAKKPAAGGFAFTIGEKTDGPVPTPTSIGGFPFSLSSSNELVGGSF